MKQAEHAVCAQPLALDDFPEHGLGVGVHLLRLAADDLIVEYLRIAAGQIPRLEKRPPVDVLGDLRQIVVAQVLQAEKSRAEGLVSLPVAGTAGILRAVPNYLIYWPNEAGPVIMEGL
jgi:hypothetical protein